MSHCQVGEHMKYQERILIAIIGVMLLTPWMVLAEGAATTFTVNTTDDSDDGTCDAAHCSLREAINAANGSAGADTIAFNIPGSGIRIIAPASPLPTITDPVTVDGTTQPGFAGSPIIQLTGINAGAGADGLKISAMNSVVRGLVINRFLGDGIELDRHSGHVIEGNFIGTNANGTGAQGNSTGIFVGSDDTTIGGTTAAARNIISGNGYGIYMDSVQNVVVQGNFIGTDVTGTGDVHNTREGIYMHASSDNTIGGTTAGAGNTIAFNGPAFGDNGITLALYFFGIGTGNLIQGNSIFSNAGLGIDLLPAGVTPNDDGDGDSGPNYLQNFPVLTSAVSGGSRTRVEGTLNSAPDTSFTLEFFANSACDASGYGEGETPLGTAVVTTDGGGNAGFNVTFATVVPAGQFITATATNPNNNTSEFSQCVQVVAVPCYDWQPPDKVGVEDIQEAANHWRGPYDPRYDVAPDPPDGVINILDVMTVAAALGGTCP